MTARTYPRIPNLLISPLLMGHRRPPGAFRYAGWSVRPKLCPTSCRATFNTRLMKRRYSQSDEMDSGLDIDALKVVSEGINSIFEETNLGLLLITHYQRILNYVEPHFVHIMSEGKIVKSGGSELARELEEFGYEKHI